MRSARSCDVAHAGTSCRQAVQDAGGPLAVLERRAPSPSARTPPPRVRRTSPGATISPPVPAASSAHVERRSPPGHLHPQVERGHAARDLARPVARTARGRSRASRRSARGCSSTCASSFQAATQARWTNSCGVTPTLGRSALSAAISVAVAGREPAAVARHRRALADSVLTREDVREVADLQRARRRAAARTTARCRPRRRPAARRGARQRSAASRRNASGATAPVGLFG